MDVFLRIVREDCSGAFWRGGGEVVFVCMCMYICIDV